MSRIEKYTDLVVRRAYVEKYNLKHSNFMVNKISVCFLLSLKDLTVVKFLEILRGIEMFSGVKVKYSLNLESGFIDFRVTYSGILLYNFLENFFNVYTIMLLKKQVPMDFGKDSNKNYFIRIKNIRDIINLYIELPYCMLESIIYFNINSNDDKLFKFLLESLGCFYEDI